MGVLTLDMIGGLGNQLFEIGTAYAYAKQHGFELIFSDTWDYKKGREPIWDFYFKEKKDTMPWKLVPRHIHNSISWHRLRESAFLYNPIYLHADIPYSMLCGYFF
jgi:hypothetical protein